jgi:protein SCO1/2
MNTDKMNRSGRRLVRRPLLAAALALIPAAALSACSTPAASSSSGGNSGFVVQSAPTSLFDGDQLPKPFSKPDVTLTDSKGSPFNLVQGTAGKLTLVYFGYTHCPDVCPTTMATLASTMHALTPAQAAKIDVVFVSTDPTRDTPTVLHTWLGQFDPAFIGLTGSFSTIQKAASALGIDIEPPVALPGGGYTITHGAEVIAFDAKGEGDVVYTAGATVAQFQHDIPLLLAGRDE